MKENSKVGGIAMDKPEKQETILFHQYRGTQHAFSPSETSACADSLASMTANTVFVVENAPLQYESKPPVADDPSSYEI